MERRSGIVEGYSNTKDETSPLLSVNDSHTGIDDRNQRINQNKGFTLRRCMVLPWFVCYCLAGGVFMYAVPQYTKHRMVEKHKNDHVNISVTVLNDFRETLHTNDCFNDKRETDAAQKETAMWSMYYTLASFIPALFANLLWSSYSDILGRRFALLIGCSGITIRLGLFAVVVYFDLSLVYMVIGAAIDGMGGSFMLLISALYSFVSDITEPGKMRTIAVVVVELVVGLSFTVSSFSSGYIITAGGFLYPAIACFFVDVLGILILIFIVPETRQRDRAQSRSRNVFKVLAESFKFYFHCGATGNRRKYSLLIFGLVFVAMPAMSRSTMEMLYQMGRPFCWNPKKIGYFGSIKSVISSITSMCGALLLRQCLADDTIATVTVYMNGVSYIIESLAACDAVLYTVPLFASLSNLPLPMIRSLMSCLTPDDKQGVMYAGIGILEGICALIGSVSNTAVYTATLSIMNGFVFILMALFTFIGATFLLVFRYVNRTVNIQNDDMNINEETERTDTA